jgi:hypothetical protein
VGKLLLCNTPRSISFVRASLIGALFGVLLTGCAGDVPIPFMNSSLPPTPPGPAPDYPTNVAPTPGTNQLPVLTDSERQAVEDQLKKLVQDRENTIKKRIDKN